MGEWTWRLWSSFSFVQVGDLVGCGCFESTPDARRLADNVVSEYMNRNYVLAQKKKKYINDLSGDWRQLKLPHIKYTCWGI